MPGRATEALLVLALFLSSSRTLSPLGHRVCKPWSLGARPIRLEALTSSSLLARSLVRSLVRSRARTLSSLPSSIVPSSSLRMSLPLVRRDSRRWCSVLTVAPRAWTVGGSARTVAHRSLVLLLLRLCHNPRNPRRRTPASRRC